MGFFGGGVRGGEEVFLFFFLVCFYTMVGIPIAFLHFLLMMRACICAKQFVISFVRLDAVQNVLH